MALTFDPADLGSPLKCFVLNVRTRNTDNTQTAGVGTWRREHRQHTLDHMTGGLWRRPGRTNVLLTALLVLMRDFGETRTPRVSVHRKGPTFLFSCGSARL